MYIYNLFLSFLFMFNIPSQHRPLIIGHRGCRGLLPENTIEAFQKALTYNIDGIEWDVVVNKDKHLVISHEEFMSKDYCLTPNHKEIKRENDHLLYHLTQKEIEQYDCGSKPYDKFPEQTHFRAYKPLVQEAFEKLDLGDKILLFEIKSEQKNYNTAQPPIDEYIDIVLKEVSKSPYRNNIVFMSFDALLLNALHKKAPEFPLVFLHESIGKSAKKILSEINFTPYALGIYHKFIRKPMIDYSHDKNIKVFAWTVNKSKDFNRLKKIGIDVIITDYPNLFEHRIDE